MQTIPENIEHRIQLKKIEIKNYEQSIKNYPPQRMQTHGEPYLRKLQNELIILNNELEDREKQIRKNIYHKRRNKRKTV